jgi:adenylosuccinate lyase|tara:strand:- start:2560 stop:3912 length:1353 start_codon:yes stop_codon:yes gene_type:complete
VSNHQLNSISPLDGRYRNSVKQLSEYFSEKALMRYRLMIEVEYLIALANEKKIKELSNLSDKQKTNLRKLYKNFSDADATQIKSLEKTTMHDVKSVEYFLQSKLPKKIHPWVHFSLTSEDVNNLSYSLMWKDAVKDVYFSSLIQIQKSIKSLAKKYKKTSMLSLTHGQPATPTTFGKELAVFGSRLNRQIDQIKTHKLMGKFGGTTGTWSAQLVAYPNVNWINFATKFIRTLGLNPNIITTQIEPHDSIAESFHQIIRVNTILTDLCRDMWSYISRNVLIQKKVAGEVGSSTMPHKINPIQFENAEGNMGISNAILIHLSTKLPISRMQRDLTDSTTLRNQGVALSHSYLALINILNGLSRITINQSKIKSELNEHWEVLAEAIQTILRKSGKTDAYEQLKLLTRGKKIDQEVITQFVSSLSISSEDKETLLSLCPESYIGLSPQLAEMI